MHINTYINTNINTHVYTYIHTCTILNQHFSSSAEIGPVQIECSNVPDMFAGPTRELVWDSVAIERNISAITSLVKKSFEDCFMYVCMYVYMYVCMYVCMPTIP